MSSDRRTFIAGFFACTAMAVVFSSPALAAASNVLPFPTSNLVTNMVAAANDNVGLARRVGGKLAVAAGETYVGSSLWKVLLGRGPVGRIFTIAGLAGLAYELFKSDEDTFSAGPVNSPPGAGDVQSSNGVVVTDSVSFSSYLASIPIGSHAIYVEQGSHYSVSFNVWVQVVSDGSANMSLCPIQLSFDGGNSWVNWNSSSGRVNNLGEFKQLGSKWYRRALVLFPLPNSSPFKWRWLDSENLAQDQVQGNALLPDQVPDNADIKRQLIADVLNDAVDQALANDPELAAEVGTAHRITAQEVAELLPELSPAGQVGPSKLTMPSPTHNPFTGQAPSTNPVPNDADLPGGGGPTDGVPPAWTDPMPLVPLPDDPPAIDIPKPDAIGVRLGSNICPPIVGFTAHCPILEAARPGITRVMSLLGFVAVGGILLKD